MNEFILHIKKPLTIKIKQKHITYVSELKFPGPRLITRSQLGRVLQNVVDYQFQRLILQFSA